MFLLCCCMVRECVQRKGVSDGMQEKGNAENLRYTMTMMHCAVSAIYDKEDPDNAHCSFALHSRGRMIVFIVNDKGTKGDSKPRTVCSQRRHAVGSCNKYCSMRGVPFKEL